MTMATYYAKAKQRGKKDTLQTPHHTHTRTKQIVWIPFRSGRTKRRCTPLSSSSPRSRWSRFRMRCPDCSHRYGWRTRRSASGSSRKHVISSATSNASTTHSATDASSQRELPERSSVISLSSSACYPQEPPTRRSSRCGEHP